MPTTPTTVVWLAPEAAVAPGASAALTEWAGARGMRLSMPSDGIAPEIQVQLSIGDRVEEELDRAREALTALDPDGTERALARAEAALRAHPELPHAAWLMAEVERAWAARWLRIAPRDEERAARAWQRAAGLDGGRIAGVGEASAQAPVEVKATLAIEGASEYQVRLDGALLTTFDVARAEGEHALVISDSGVTRFAAWVSIAAGATIRVRVPTAPPCSAVDVSRARARVPAESAGVRADGVRCARWIAVATGTRPGTVRVATCEGSSCGPLVDWHEVDPALAQVPAQAPEAERTTKLPTWASLALFGAGIVVSGTVAVLVSEAMRKPEQETRFVNGGIKTQRFGFDFP